MAVEPANNTTDNKRGPPVKSAIPTKLRGVTYRSRLEARWAEFFLDAGWRAHYEPFDGDGYIPDFLVDGDHPFFVEVKPALTLAEYMAPTAKVERGLAEFGHEWIVVGASPLPLFDDGNWGPEFPTLGVGYDKDCGLGAVRWMGCQVCKSAAWFHSTHSYRARPCGHADDELYTGPTISRGGIESLWSRAGEAVRWQRR